MQPRQVECGFQVPALLNTYGPTIQVLIGFDPDFIPGTLPSGLPNRPHYALIDTGAGVSCIDAGLSASLGLPIVDRQPASGGGGPDHFNVSLAQIHVPSLPFTIYGGFMCVHLVGQPHMAILGRDFLQSFTMVYHGPTGSVALQLK